MRWLIALLLAALTGCDGAGNVALGGILMIAAVPFGFALMFWPEHPNSIYERMAGAVVGVGALVVILLLLVGAASRRPPG